MENKNKNIRDVPCIIIRIEVYNIIKIGVLQKRNSDLMLNKENIQFIHNKDS